MTERVAFITGASRGVGAAVARAFHGDGMRVALASRTGDDLGLEGALGVECDVRDPDVVSSAVDAAVERFGGLDVVVANAGVGAYGPFLEMDPDEVEAMIDVNLKGTLYTARFTLPHLIERKGDSSRWPRSPACGRSPARAFTTRRSSGSSASRARWTTSCASKECG